ncbi:phosphate acyltransferase [Alphaproteobacteria bacterium]|nr:phosphate acyltransferase [Alphaproteobacteria bacterium]
MIVTQRITIALDGMGGDDAPLIVVEGIGIARERLPHVDYLLFGDEAELVPLLDRRPAVRDACQVRHTPDRVKGEDKPSTVLRQGRQSSMWLAVDAVAKGEALGVVSAGNTGALMAVSKFVLKMLPGLSRPAICAFFPSMRGETIVLDLGANVDCDSGNLVEFAIMGEMFARVVLNIEKPTVGILNIGSEELKGNDAVRHAASILRESGGGIDFRGFVEGDDIAEGTVDVVVTDGFSGNIALKTAEGLVKLYSSFLHGAFTSSWVARAGYLLARPALRKVRLRTDPRRYNGAVFLGLSGIAVKSHGGTDPVGFANAIGVAADLISNDLNGRIKAEFERLRLDSGLPAFCKD